MEENEILEAQLAMLREYKELEDKNKHLEESLDEARILLEKAMNLLDHLNDPDFVALLASLKIQVSFLK